MHEIRNKIIEITNKETEQGESRLFMFINEQQADNEYLNYLYNSYNIKLKGIIFVKDEIVLEQFKKIGGEFSSEELKKLKFTILKRKAVKQPDINNIQKNIENNNKLSDFYAAKCRYYIDNNNYSEAVKNCDIAIKFNERENYNHKEYKYLRAIAKIKNSDIKDSVKDNNNKTIIESIIQITHKLGIKTVSEGIETEEQMNFLKQVRCDYGQGFLLGKPVVVETFINTYVKELNHV